MTPLEEFELGDGGDLLTSAVARAAALRRARARCRGVEAPAHVRRRPDGVVAYDAPAAVGASLGAVRSQGPLTVGQCVTVGVGVAEALAAMHAERVAHGDVSAKCVFVDGKRVALAGTMSALEDGRTGASPAGDVAALGVLLRSLADDSATPIINAWTEPLVAEPPRDRPTAAHAAAALARCAPMEPIRAPAAPVAAAMRASVVDRVEPHPRDRWWRVERSALRLSPLAGLAAVAAIAGAALVPAVAMAPPRLSLGAETATRAPTLPVSEAARLRPEVAAESIAERRIAALGAGEGVALLALTVPGGAAARSDGELAAAMREGEADFRGIHLTDVEATLVREVPGGAIVEVTSELSGYGVGQERQAAGTATARLKLALTARGWLVERILPPP